ncbi:MAG: MBL fold metallo-hydrolase [Firmicutes bacterium]|nr:MBL fold metallo-hydrolase [Bacillota bacterium]
MENEKKYELKTMVLPPIGTNCYLLIDKATRQAAIIDPAAAGERILKVLQDANATPAVIINTHGHWDHTGANHQLQELTGAPLLIHEADAPMLSNAALSSAAFFGAGIENSRPDRLLHDKDVIEVGELKLEVLHTPGHSPGGICLFTEDLCFSGDTLFKLSMGRTDLPGSDETQMEYSLNKLMRYSDELTVLPGHGPSTNIGYERKFNPYIG